MGLKSIRLSYANGDILNESMEEVNAELNEGSVTVKNFIYGDVYADGVINSKDIVKLRQYPQSSL